MDAQDRQQTQYQLTPRSRWKMHHHCKKFRSQNVQIFGYFYQNTDGLIQLRKIARSEWAISPSKKLQPFSGVESVSPSARAQPMAWCRPPRQASAQNNTQSDGAIFIHFALCSTEHMVSAHNVLFQVQYKQQIVPDVGTLEAVGNGCRNTAPQGSCAAHSGGPCGRQQWARKTQAWKHCKSSRTGGTHFPLGGPGNADFQLWRSAQVVQVKSPPPLRSGNLEV